jgi:inositol transport system substrate-binding protein
MAQRTIHILLTRSGTWFSRLIHIATHDNYTHASIGLDGPGGCFYSFGRKDPRFVLPAGLVKERVGTAPCCLYELTVSEQTYVRLRHRLEGMYERRDEYHYNILGAFSCYFNYPLRRRYHFFCSQFVAQMLQETGAVDLPKPPTLLRPVDFCGCAQLRLIPLEDALAAAS